MNNKQPPDNSRREPSDNRKFLMRYASLGTQLLVAIGLGVFAGIELDKWLHVSPLLACILPLLILGLLFYKLMKETKPPKDEK